MTAATATRGRDFTPTRQGVQGEIYLLHFDRPFGHAKHYLGWASNLEARLHAHATGRGARLTEVVRAAGIGWSLARTWCGDRYEERRLKGHSGTRYCPICKGETDPATLPHFDSTTDTWKV